MWMGERAMHEVQALRDMDDKLFNWTATLFVTAFGALVGLRGFGEQQTWSPIWRVLLCATVIAIVGGVILLAFQIRDNLARKQRDVHHIMVEMGREDADMMSTSALDSRLFFTIRWGMIAILGMIAVVLVWISLPTAG
jgi:1,4-dihydroxy-2-naphthoate octaprenyltransferase